MCDNREPCLLHLQAHAMHRQALKAARVAVADVHLLQVHVTTLQTRQLAQEKHQLVGVWSTPQVQLQGLNGHARIQGEQALP